MQKFPPIVLKTQDLGRVQVDRKGTAVCVLTADILFFSRFSRSQMTNILLVRRLHMPFQGYYAIPGGKMMLGETVEGCAIREAHEETGLVITLERLKLVGVFSTPGRDPRGPFVSVAYIVMLSPEEMAKAVGGDDVADAKIFNVRALPPLAFDHATIVNVAVKLLQ